MHGLRWRQYWENNFIVRLVPDSPILPIGEDRIEEELGFNQPDPYEELADFLYDF